MSKRRQFGALRQLPSGGWQARYRDGETGKMVSLGVFKTSKAAGARLDAARTDQHRGAFVDPRAGQMVFNDYATKWLAERDLRARTRDVYASLLRLHLVPTFGDEELGVIQSSAVRSWHSRLNRKHPATAAKAYRLLRAILHTACDDDLIARNPCRVKGAGIDRSPERPVATLAEVAAATDAMPDRLAVAVVLAAWCGLRRGEILGLRRRDVDLMRGVIRVEQTVNELSNGTVIIGPPKSDASARTVAIPPNVVPVLSDHVAHFVDEDQDAPILTGERGGPITGRSLSAAWRRARVEGAGRPDLHFHDLRHTSNTWAAASGASTAELMRRLGHASATAALRYQHASENRDRVIAAAMAQLVSATPPTPITRRK